MPGVYAIAGHTNLPEKTQIMVAAIRYLYPAKPASKQFNPNPDLCCPGVSTRRVKSGKQTTLNLWETSADGRLQEAWQLDQAKLNLALDSADEVVFLATLAPVNNSDQLQQLEKQLGKQKIQLSRKL